MHVGSIAHHYNGEDTDSMSAMREMLPQALFSLFPDNYTHTIHTGSVVSINRSHYFLSNYIDII